MCEVETYSAVVELLPAFDHATGLDSACHRGLAAIDEYRAIGSADEASERAFWFGFSLYASPAPPPSPNVFE